jgi:hydrogenase maturation factor
VSTARQTDAATCCDHDGGCITCGDVAVRMRVLELDAVRRLAVCVDADGRSETVDVGIVEAVLPGDSLLVHAGTALHRDAAREPTGEPA